MKIAEMYGLGAKYIAAKDILFGVECEVESVNSEVVWDLNSTIIREQDSSLRNSGVEFLLPPQNRVDTVTFFRHLHAKVAFYKQEEKFSDRTSTHVHVNCKNLTPEQVRNIVLLYALFEEVFFLFSSPRRRNNIHCVALTDTFLPRLYQHDLNALIGSWHKYTALNLKPLSTLGTLEFRHMHGTDDHSLLNEWLTVIERLFLTGRETMFDYKNLSDEQIELIGNTLFSGTRAATTAKGMYVELTQNSALDLKLYS